MTACQRGPVSHPSDREEVRARIEEVLERPEFGRGRNGFSEWLDENLRGAVEWLGDLLGFEPEAAETILRLLLVVLAIGLLAALARLVVRTVRARARAGSGPAASPTEERVAGVAALRREAQAAAARGERVAALRLYFRALVLGLSERGQLEYRDAWTNRELLQRGAPRREVVPLLAPLVPRLDAQSFGREPVEPADVARLAELCDRLLAPLPGGVRT